MYQHITVIDYEWGKEIQFNRPDKHNALNIQMVSDLKSALKKELDTPKNMLLLSGKGESFCSGQDVEESIPDNEIELKKYIESMQQITEYITSYPYPVIAKVRGYALGAGCEIALNADLIYATEEAVFGFPELKVGLSITQGSSYLLPRLVGLQKAKELIFFSKSISAQEMVEFQLINESINEEEIDQEVSDRLRYLNGLNKYSLQSIKKLFHSGLENTLQDQLILESKEITKLIGGG